MAKVTITIEDISANEADLKVEFGEGGYDEQSGAHRLAFTLTSAIEHTGPVFDINPEADGSEGGAHD